MKRTLLSIVGTALMLGVTGTHPSASSPLASISSTESMREPAAPSTYWAACDSQHGLIVGWIGPSRATYDAAQKDADAHAKRFGHSASVVISQ